MKKSVLLTGATGTMGGAALRHLSKHLDQLQLSVLVRPSKKNQKLMKNYANKIEIIWGDLTNYQDVKKALSSVDYILHTAALVSPKADKNPDLAYKINVGSMKNILKAIEELNLKYVKLVNIGSVAQTGSRLFPVHWGRVGDPIKASIDDYYASSKIEAERLVIESNLKYWVSLRQTGILHEGLLSMMEGIMFHQPLNNVLEWVTDEDSGRLLTNLVLKDLDDDFFRKVYNIGGGKACRLNNYEFLSKIFNVLKINNIEKIFETNWFASKNFHGQYYLDSDQLNDILDFRRETFNDFLLRLKTKVKFPLTLLAYLPQSLVKNLVMKRICEKKSGPLYWINNNETEKINAFFGSKDQWLKIKGWSDFTIRKNYDQVFRLDYGYDINKPIKNISIVDLKSAAKFRGGKLLSKDFKDFYQPVMWECAFKHKFAASPNLILKAGHWCPKCAPPAWNYEKLVKKDFFLAQVIDNGI